MRYFISLSLIFCSLFILSCKNEDDSPIIEYSSTYEGLYLRTNELGYKELCYRDCNKENLNTKIIYQNFNNFSEDYDIDKYYHRIFHYSKTPSSFKQEDLIQEKYNILEGWWTCYNFKIQYIDLDFCIKFSSNGNLTFRADGNQDSFDKLEKMLNLQTTEKYLSFHNYRFSTYKLYSKDNKIYINIYFYEPKLQLDAYGKFSENLTINDFIFKSLITYEYISVNDKFVLLSEN